jgi:deoxyribodipyrimidine photo-lyase
VVGADHSVVTGLVENPRDRDDLRGLHERCAAPKLHAASLSRNSGSINAWRDQRLHDLPPLLHAAAAEGEVLACYVLDPRLKASSLPRRLQYLYEALRDLRESLDGRLLVTRGRPEKRIPLLTKEIGATSVHVSADQSPFGRRRDDAVRDALGDVQPAQLIHFLTPSPASTGNEIPVM